MKNYQKPEITVIQFHMIDRITFHEAGEEIFPGTVYSESVELWD